MCISDGSAAHVFAQENYPKGIYVPSSAEFDGLLNGDCGLVFTYVNKWETVKIDKTGNGDCDLEWVGRTVGFNEAGFALKGDSGRLCTSLVQDVLNLHLVEMNRDGTMELLKKKFQQKLQDIDCEAIDAAAGAAKDSSQLSFKEMAGPFLVHSILTSMALVLAAVSVFFEPIKQKDPELEDDDSAINKIDESDDDDDDSESGLVMINVDEPPREEDRRANRRAGRLSMLPQGTELRGIRQTQKEQGAKQDAMMAQLASITAVLNSMQGKEASRYPKRPSGE
jgi:hypothetical protein